MKKEQIIFFDGVCIFCNSFVKFIVKKDKKNLFKLCPLQSDLAKNFAEEYAFSEDIKNLNSLILLKNNRIFRKSTAAIEIVSELGFPYLAVKIFLLIPRKLRDIFYDYFAKNRYKWFGKKEVCEFGDKEIRSRILDASRTNFH
jgi:predicted DCC family thiol-disulfide oxidoreductase YuxK